MVLNVKEQKRGLIETPLPKHKISKKKLLKENLKL